jgi:hypothetical protein
MKLPHSLPSVIEISPTRGLDLDERLAVKSFHGKDRRAAFEMFNDNAGHWTDCLHAMGPIAFRYYFPSYLDYLRTQTALAEPGCLHSLLTVLEARQLNKDTFESSFQGIERDTIDALEYIENHKEEFDLDLKIYGDVFTKLNRWRRVFRKRAVANQ